MDDTEPQYVKQSEYARMRGWTPDYVSRMKRRGLVKTLSGYVDVAASDDRIAQGTKEFLAPLSPKANGREPQTAAGSLIEAQARAAQARAQLLELKIQQTEATLIDRVEAEAMVRQAFIEVRTELLQLPERITSQVRDAPSEHEARQIVDRDVRATLTRCADKLKKIGH